MSKIPTILAVALLAYLPSSLLVPERPRPATTTSIESPGRRLQDDRAGGEHPDAAAQQRLRERLDEHGRIPFDAQMKAKEQRDTVVAMEGGGGVDRGSWRWLGPQNIGGRCRALVIHPANANRMVLASASGGLWITPDAGQVWNPVDDFLPVLTVSTLASHASLPDVIYAGTGEAFTGAAGAGIYRSMDFGFTWSRLPSTINANFDFVSKIVIHPTNAGTLLAATRTGVWRTVDAGITWSRVRTSAANERFYDLEWNVVDPNRVVAGSNQAAYYSLDGGSTWGLAGGMPAGALRVELGMSASSRTIVWANVFSTGDQTYVMRSSNGGISYIEIPANRSLGARQGDYNNTVWVSPLNSQHVLIGGVTMIRTLDNGALWQDIQGALHPDIHAVVPHPAYNGTTNKTVLVCCDGGVYQCTDIHAPRTSVTWTSLNQTLGITQFHGGAVSATNRVFGGTQDRGSVISQGTNRTTFTNFYPFDGGDCAADSADSTFMYGESQFAGVFRYSGSGQPFRFDPPEAGMAADGPFIAPLVLDPNDDRRLYSGQWQLFVCDPKAATPVWRSIAPNRSSHVLSIAVAPGNSDVVYVGYGSGQIWKTTNARATTPTWTRVSASPLPARVPLKIVVHPRSPERVYVSFGGYSSNNVAYSSNGGATWSLRGGSGSSALPAAPIRSLAVHPVVYDWIYAGTEVGLFVSTDNGASWSASDEGPAAADISELVFRGSDLYAFTYGRGIFLAQATPPVDPHSQYSRVNLGTFGAEGNALSRQASMSDDGRLVAFASVATNLTPADTNGTEDVFLRDRNAGSTTRISVGAASGTGFIQGNGASRQPAVARSGRFVAFQSLASNLVTGDTNGAQDIFVRDLQGQVTELVSKWGADSYLPGLSNGPSDTPSISADGRFVVFGSNATNLVNGIGGDTNLANDVFVRDRLLETLSRISVSDTGVQANRASRVSPRAISDDGRYVVFTSDASNLVAGDTNGVADIFVRDRVSNRTTRVSVSSTGQEADTGSSTASISGDGRYVTFSSLASNLVAGDLNGQTDVFLHDRQTRQTRRLSVTPANASANGSSLFPIISATGNAVVFESGATNLVPGDTNGRTDLFLYDIAGGFVELVSDTWQGAFANDVSSIGDLTADGTSIAYGTAASNIVLGDLNGVADIIVRRRSLTRALFPLSRVASDGSTSTGLPFGLPTARVQQAARETKGLPLTFERLSFRRDITASGSAFGRTVDVELRLGSTDIDNMQTSFAANYVGASRVGLSRRNVSLPDWRNSVAGIAGFDATIPLEVPYFHDGARHLLWDLTVFGSSSSGNYIADADASLRTLSSTGDSVGSGCGTFDLSSSYFTNGLTSSLSLNITGAPVSQPVTYFLGISDPMLTLPGFCGMVRVDPLISTGIGTTSAQGGLSVSLPFGPYDPALGGTPLQMQALTPDPSRAPVPVSLSDGVRHILPSGSPGALLRRLWANSATAANGTLEGQGAVFQLDR